MVLSCGLSRLVCRTTASGQGPAALSGDCQVTVGEEVQEWHQAISFGVQRHASTLRTRQFLCRVLEISDQVRTVLGQSAAECSMTPAPAHSEGGDSATSVAARRACKVNALQ